MGSIFLYTATYHRWGKIIFLCCHIKKWKKIVPCWNHFYCFWSDLLAFLLYYQELRVLQTYSRVVWWILCSWNIFLFVRKCFKTYTKCMIKTLVEKEEELINNVILWSWYSRWHSFLLICMNLNCQHCLNQHQWVYWKTIEELLGIFYLFGFFYVILNTCDHKNLKIYFAHKPSCWQISRQNSSLRKYSFLLVLNTCIELNSYRRW